MVCSLTGWRPNYVIYSINCTILYTQRILSIKNNSYTFKTYLRIDKIRSSTQIPSFRTNPSNIHAFLVNSFIVPFSTSLLSLCTHFANQSWRGLNFMFLKHFNDSHGTCSIFFDRCFISHGSFSSPDVFFTQSQTKRDALLKFWFSFCI